MATSNASRFCYLVDPTTDVGYGVKQVGNKPIVLVNLADTNGAELAAWVNGVQLRTTLFESAGGEFKQDLSTGAFATIDYEHYEIHARSYYRFGFQKDVSNGGTAILAVTTPNTTAWFHFRPSVDAEAEIQVMLYENPTSVTGGSAVIPRNANRNSDNTSSLTVVSDPTVNTTGATVLGNVVVGAGKSSGGSVAAENEWILKQNTTYVIVVTNNTSSNNQVNIRCAGYEHTNR